MRKIEIKEISTELKHILQDKIDNLNKPKGSLGMLEEIALQIGLIQQTCSPTLSSPHHILFGADHGIEHEGVSVSPREITWQQMINFTKGGGGVNMFCRQHAFCLRLIDMGVDHDLSGFPQIENCKIRLNGTGNFRNESAMTSIESDKCLATGARIVEECHANGCNVISFGEMGIGNTSPSSIWMSLLLDIPLKDCVGAGAGLNPSGIQRKYSILKESVNNFICKNATPSAEDIMVHFGGFEMVAAVGAMLRAAELEMIVLVDGFIMTACALMASKLSDKFINYAIFGHCGDESGHKLMLESMNVHAVLHLGMRLGEGTGAICSYPIIESAVRMLNEMNDFGNANITKYF